MKEGWTYKKLGEVCYKITDGSHNPPKGIEHSDNVMLSSQNVQNGFLDMSAVRYLSDADFEIENKRTNASKGDVLLTIVGTIGRTCVLKGNEGNITFQRSVAILKPKEEIMSRYLMFFLMSCNSKLNSTAHGAAQKGIYLKQLGDITLHYPSIEEQQRIVERLDAAFENIDKLKANAEKQLAEARTLFQKSLAKAMKPKEGWEEKNVKDLSLLITKGSSPKWQGNSYVDSDGILFVTSENVREGSLVLNPAKYVDKSFNQKQGRSILKKDDVLVNIVGASIGRAAIFDIDVDDANINQAVCLVRLDKQILSPRYLCLFLNSEHAFRQYAAMVKDTARANLSLENIGSLKIGVPSLAEQQRIVERLDALSENIRKYEEIQRQIISECDALKQALLRKVFE